MCLSKSRISWRLHTTSTTTMQLLHFGQLHHFFIMLLCRMSCSTLTDSNGWSVSNLKGHIVSVSSDSQVLTEPTCTIFLCFLCLAKKCLHIHRIHWINGITWVDWGKTHNPHFFFLKKKQTNKTSQHFAKISLSMVGSSLLIASCTILSCIWTLGKSMCMKKTHRNVDWTHRFTRSKWQKTKKTLHPTVFTQQSFMLHV